MSEQLQNIISKSHKEAKSIPLTQKYMAWYRYFNNTWRFFYYLTKHPLLVINTIIVNLNVDKTWNFARNNNDYSNQYDNCGCRNSNQRSRVVGWPNNSQNSITSTTWVRARFASYKKRWPQVAAASNKGYLPMVGGSLRLLPPLKLVFMI